MLQLSRQLTQNVLGWLILTTFLISVSGCSWFTKVEPIDVQTSAVDKTPLNLPLPEPLRLQFPQWIVITDENVDEVFAQLKEDGNRAVVFAITPFGYEQMSIDFLEIRNVIEQQQQIILQYKEYYEPQKEETE